MSATLQPEYCPKSSDEEYEKWPEILAGILRGYDLEAKLTLEEKQAVFYVICSIQMICIAFFESNNIYKELAKTNRQMFKFIIQNKEKIKNMSSKIQPTLVSALNRTRAGIFLYFNYLFLSSHLSTGSRFSSLTPSKPFTMFEMASLILSSFSLRLFSIFKNMDIKILSMPLSSFKGKHPPRR